MENSKKWSVDDQTKYVVGTMPIEKQAEYWMSKYESAMSIIQLFLEEDLGKVLVEATKK